MNHCRILHFLVPAFLLMQACAQIDVSKPTKLSVEAASISMSSATINLVVTGDLPSSCRYADPVLKSEYDATEAPESELCAYLDLNGKFSTLPAAYEYDGLQPSSEYVMVVEWTNGDSASYTVGQFKTLAPSEFIFSVVADDNKCRKGDKAGVVSYDRIETKNENIISEFGYRVSDNETVFLPSSELQLPQLGQERLYIYYPYKENTWLDESDFCIHSVIPDTQTGDDRTGLQHSWAICEVNNSSTTVTAGITKALCRMHFNINLSEYPGYALRMISIFDALGKTCFAGEYAVDPEKLTVKAVAGRASSSVSARNEIPSAEGKASVTILPGDYTAGDIILLIYLENASGENHTVPVRYKGAPINIKPGEEVDVNIESLVAAENPYPWFEYNESRDLLGNTAYGAQNTWLVEEGGSVTFEVKARGDALKAVAPKYYGIMLASNLKNEKLLQMPDGVEEYEQVPTREIPDDYRITVKCKSGTSSSFGVVAIYDDNHNVLWSFMIWKYEQGDPVQSVSYAGIPNYVYMDRALGARRSIASALQKGKAGVGAAYFTWGRKDPFPWKNQVPTHYLTQEGAGKDLQYSIAHPNVKMQDVSGGPGYWYGNGTDKQMRKDLWGAENKTTSPNRNLVGHKTIYDPCPEGYRVPDYDALYRVNEKRHLAEIEFASSDVRYALQHDASAGHLEFPCPFSDMSAFAIEKTDGDYDYWLYHGCLWASDGWMNATTTDTVAGYCYWSNTNENTSKFRGSIIRGWYNGGGTKWFLDTADNMAGSYPVRCQKEN